MVKKHKCGLYFWIPEFEVVNIILLSEIDFMNHPLQSVFLDYDFSFFHLQSKDIFLYIITSLL